MDRGPGLHCSRDRVRMTMLDLLLIMAENQFANGMQ